MVKGVSDYKEILRLEDLDAAVIATPVSTHYQIAKDFLSQGKNVFIEKPITHSSETAYELVKLAEKEQKVLMVNLRKAENCRWKNLPSLLRKGYSKPDLFNFATY